MISIVKIIGESYDLTTGEEVRKSIVLTNGTTSRSVEASEELIGVVLTLMAEDRNLARASYVSPTSTEQKPPPTRRRPAPRQNDDDYDPGEEYAEKASGLPSI